VDSVTFGAQASDVSEGRYPDGVSDIRQMNPTPGASNVASSAGLTLGSPGDQLVYPGEVLTVQLSASGIHASEPLTYALGIGVKPGATIDSATGLFSWAVPGAELQGITQFQVRVTNNQNPSETASTSFKVTTLNLPVLIGVFEKGLALLKWQTASGKVYRLQTTSNLGTAPWVTVNSDWIENGDYIEVRPDENSTGKRFFRVIVVK